MGVAGSLLPYRSTGHVGVDKGVYQKHQEHHLFWIRAVYACGPPLTGPTASLPTTLTGRQERCILAFGPPQPGNPDPCPPYPLVDVNALGSASPDRRAWPGSTFTSERTTSCGAGVSPTVHVTAASSDGPAPANVLEHDYNGGDHQQEMDQSACRVRTA